jgi:putative DNA primase/helicase
MKKGAYWQSVKLPHIDLITTQTIGIAEGVATALTVSQLKEIPVFSAMDCGNLKSVAHVVRQRFPKSHILILGDVGNGAEQAVEAAKEVGGLCVFPEFSDELVARFRDLCGPGLPTDFNDYYLAKGEI